MDTDGAIIFTKGSDTAHNITETIIDIRKKKRMHFPANLSPCVFPFFVFSSIYTGKKATARAVEIPYIILAIRPLAIKKLSVSAFDPKYAAIASSLPKAKNLEAKVNPSRITPALAKEKLFFFSLSIGLSICIDKEWKR